MVQQIVVLCDVCYDEGATSPARSHLVGIDGDTWGLELCERHHEVLVAPLADVARRLGQAVKNGKPAGKSASKPADSMQGTNRPLSEPCLFCGAAPGRAAALVGHLRHDHDSSFGKAYGLTCPLCLHESGAASALGRHAAEHLGAGGGIPELFRHAWEAGDPHGIVGKRLADLGLTALPPLSEPGTTTTTAR